MFVQTGVIKCFLFFYIYSSDKLLFLVHMYMHILDKTKNDFTYTFFKYDFSLAQEIHACN